MNKYIISFDKSNEDIPTLIVAHELSLFNPTINIVKIITGDKAVRIFEELTKKEKSKKDVSKENVSVKSCSTCNYFEYNINTEPCFSCWCGGGKHEAWEPREVEDGT